MLTVSKITTWLVPLVLISLITWACSDDTANPKFYIAGIPDQDISLLEERFDGLANYLSEETGLTVEYVPSIDYSSVVTAFKNGDIQMAWYGGLTGVQARLATPGAQAVAQRPRDKEFQSVFIANPKLKLSSPSDTKGRSLTFGSVSSTSGHLMPRFFINVEGVNPDKDLDGPPNYSGSHDKTWKLVETGAFEVGALNEAVWESRVASGDIDTDKVQVFFTTPAYYDYHWVIQGNIDDVYGEGSARKMIDALLNIDVSKGDRERKIAEAFQTDRFIPTNNANYDAIENVARELGIIEE